MQASLSLGCASPSYSLHELSLKMKGIMRQSRKSASALSFPANSASIICVAKTSLQQEQTTNPWYRSSASLSSARGNKWAFMGTLLSPSVTERCKENSNTGQHMHSEGKKEFNHTKLRVSNKGYSNRGRRVNTKQPGDVQGRTERKDGSLSTGHGNLGKKQQRESHFTGGNRPEDIAHGSQLPYGWQVDPTPVTRWQCL